MATEEKDCHACAYGKRRPREEPCDSCRHTAKKGYSNFKMKKPTREELEARIVELEAEVKEYDNILEGFETSYCVECNTWKRDTDGKQTADGFFCDECQKPNPLWTG